MVEYGRINKKEKGKKRLFFSYCYVRCIWLVIKEKYLQTIQTWSLPAGNSEAAEKLGERNAARFSINSSLSSSKYDTEAF